MEKSERQLKQAKKKIEFLGKMINANLITKVWLYLQYNYLRLFALSITTVLAIFLIGYLLKLIIFIWEIIGLLH